MKKVLFVSHGFACFMSDIIFHGLMKLGYDVYEFPLGTHYYGGDSIFAGKKNFGKDDFCNFCYFNFKRPVLTDKEIINQDYDFIIITSWRPEQPWILEEIYKRFKGKTPIAFVDGEDDLTIRKEHFYNDVYFKREIRLNTHENENIKPITFGIIPEENPCYIFPKEKKYLLSFIASGHNIDGLRCQMFRMLKDFNNENIYYLDVERASGGFLPYKTYREILLDSKIGISIAGEGYDTYRYYEIPYFGAMLMADTPTIKFENNFTDMVNAVFFKNLMEFNEKLDYLKKNPDVIEKITEAGRKFLMENHTSLHRAKYVISETEKL